MTDQSITPNSAATHLIAAAREAPASVQNLQPFMRDTFIVMMVIGVGGGLSVVWCGFLAWLAWRIIS